MVAVDETTGVAVEPRRNSADDRVAALRSASDACERLDLARAFTGMRLRMDRLAEVKAAFDRTIGQRLDKESRHWAAFAQAAYAGALDDAEAALRGRLADVEHPLPAAPAFRARAGNGMITLHPGPDGVHRVEYRLSPSLDPEGTALIERRPGGRCRLLAEETGPFTPAVRVSVEQAVDRLLSDPWRATLRDLLDRCVETSLYATCIVGERFAACPEGVDAADEALPLLRRSF